MATSKFNAGGSPHDGLAFHPGGSRNAPNCLNNATEIGDKQSDWPLAPDFPLPV